VLNGPRAIKIIISSWLYILAIEDEEANIVAVSCFYRDGLNCVIVYVVKTTRFDNSFI